jgi:hypothetical protein
MGHARTHKDLRARISKLLEPTVRVLARTVAQQLAVKRGDSVSEEQHFEKPVKESNHEAS